MRSTMLTMILLSIATFCGIAHAEIITIDGMIKSVDAKKRTITVETNGESKTLDLSSKAKIKVGGVVSSLDSLQAGQKVTLSYHDDLEIVLKIDAASSNPNGQDKIVLFDGKTLKGWKVLDGKKTNGWKVQNGELVLVDSKGTPSLVTVEKFEDFEFECEFWLDAKANSGVYLRGRYEVQLVDDGGYPQYQPDQKCGAIYAQLAPSEFLYRGPGQWNTLSVRLERKTVTVVLNGMKVIDQRYINNVGKAAVDDLEDQPGPILLQSHTGSARFRNLTLRRIAR